MLKFSKIKSMGHSPKLVKTAEEFEERLQQMRRWTSGPVNKTISWFVQMGIAVTSNVYLRGCNKTRAHNADVLKRVKPPYLLVSNHLTMFDDTLIDSYLYIKRGFKSLKYFPWHAPEEKNFFLGPVIAWFLKKAQCIPLTRGHGVFQPGMTRLKEILQSGGIVHIFPEGTRSRSGDIGRGQIGVGRLAYQTRAKVIPLYHDGTQDLLPIGSHKLGLGKRMEMILGEPIELEDLYNEKESREVYLKVANRMVGSIRDLRAELHQIGHGIHPIPETVEKA